MRGRTRHGVEALALTLIGLSIPLTIAAGAFRSVGGPTWFLAGTVGMFIVGSILGVLTSDAADRAAHPITFPPGWRCLGSAKPVCEDPAVPPFHGGRPRRTDVVFGQWRGRGAQWFVLAQNAVARVDLPVPLPSLLLLPRGVSQAFDVGVGEDLRTESADFGQSWRVWCQDLRYAHALLHPRVMERLLAPDAPSCGLTIDGSGIYAWEPVTRVSGDVVGARLTLLSDVIDLIPPHVWRMYGSHRAAAPTSSAGEPASIAADDQVSGPVSVRALIDAHESQGNPDFARVASREKNLLGRLSVLLFFTLWGIPVGAVLGWRGLKAAREGRANNPRMARAGLVLNSTALIMGAIGAVLGVILGR